MNSLNLAVSVITFRRAELLGKCLSSINIALKDRRYPVYVFIQDPNPEDLLILEKFKELISSVIVTESNGKNIEKLINDNRISCLRTSLFDYGHDFVICLEDDVEISSDLFSFTEQVIHQNINAKDFYGINYGSFEILGELNTYSLLRYGLHGPASLVSRKSVDKFGLRVLSLMQGRIPWDSWVEPITKKGFVATSNTARYRDNGTEGTHSTSVKDYGYFQKLAASFKLTIDNPQNHFIRKDMIHSWRHDCIPYMRSDNLKFSIKFYLVRLFQIIKLLF